MFNIPSLSTESRELLDQYTEMYERDPFCDVTMEAKLEKSAKNQEKEVSLTFFNEEPERSYPWRQTWKGS